MFEGIAKTNTTHTEIKFNLGIVSLRVLLKQILPTHLYGLSALWIV